MKITKNTTLELIKLFASYMVVFIHIMFRGKTGEIVDALARFAVPLFFLVSGYYSYQIPPVKFKKRIKHIANLLIFSVLLYTLFNVVELLMNGKIDDISLYFNRYTYRTTLIALFVFNDPISSAHLWYLFAMIYVYVVFWVLSILRFKEEGIFVISFLLLVLHISLGEGLSIFGITIPIGYVRNFILMGIPFFAMGLFVKKHENKLRSIRNCWLVVAATTGIIMSVLSRSFLGKNELYVGSLFVLFAVTVVFIKYPNIKYPLFLEALTGCSTYIYIFHIMISKSIEQIYALFNINIYTSAFMENIHPIIVCIASTILAYLITRIAKHVSLIKHIK